MRCVGRKYGRSCWCVLSGEDHFGAIGAVLGVAIDRASEERVKERPVSQGHTMKIKPGKEAARAYVEWYLGVNKTRTHSYRKMNPENA